MAEPQSYIEQAEQTLRAARKRAREGTQVRILKASAPALFEVMDSEVSLLVTRMTSDKPLPYDEYLSVHGQVVGIRRIRDLLNSREAEQQQAQAEATAIQKNINQIKNDQKPK